MLPKSSLKICMTVSCVSILSSVFLSYTFIQQGVIQLLPGTRLTGDTALNKAISPAPLQLAIYQQTNHKQEK